MTVHSIQNALVRISFFHFTHHTQPLLNFAFFWLQCLPVPLIHACRQWASCRCTCGRRSDILCPPFWHAAGMPTLLFHLTNKSVSHYLSVLNEFHFSPINGNKCIILCIDELNITRCIRWINFLARVNFSWIFLNAKLIFVSSLKQVQSALGRNYPLFGNNN